MPCLAVSGDVPVKGAAAEWAGQPQRWSYFAVAGDIESRFIFCLVDIYGLPLPLAALDLEARASPCPVVRFLACRR